MRDIDFLNIMMARALLVGSVAEVHENDRSSGWEYIVYCGDTTSYHANFEDAMAYLGRLIPQNDRIMQRLYDEAC